MTTAVVHKTVNRAATVLPAPAVKPVRLQFQSSLKVSKPDDPLEKEADQTAKKVMRSPYLARFHDATGLIQRKNVEAQPNVASSVAADIQNSMASGAPLPLSVRRFMEPRFSADFKNVRTHTGDKAARLNQKLSAQAFTVGNHIFFGKDKFQPETPEGKELIAHELTHTIQQETTQQSPAQVQRLGLSDALDYFADKANMIPGFRMFTIVLGVNPINMSKVDRSAANILRALIEFLPGGGLITQALENHAVFDKVGNWVEQQIRTLGLVGASIKQAVADFLDSLSWTDIFDLEGVWNRAKRIFTEPIDRIISFAAGLVTGIIKFIKDAILRPLASLAEGTRGYDLLKAVLGEDPITGDPVSQTADTLIGGFMKLIGQEEVWNNLKQANAVARAWAWFQGALAAVKGFVRHIPSLFIGAFQSLEIADIILVPRAFAKVAAVFASFIGSFLSWAGNAVWNLLEIIFDVVSPGAFSYVKRTGAALKSILKNPLPFVGNLVKAAKLGFQNFAANIGAHFKAGLIDWLTGSLPSVYIPRSFELGELVKFVFSALGLTWQNVRTKLVKAVGETTVKVMETAFDIVVTLVTQGPAAAWDKIKDQLANLKDMVIGGITDFVIDMVVKKAVPKLIAMFIPGAGFISAILSIYDTIMVFVNKISKIIQVVTGFINSIVAIAAGAIGTAAAKVESTLAGLLALAISFLAGFAGLGKVADKLMLVINKVRAPIDKALDWLVNWIVTMAKNLGKFAVGAVKGLLNWGSVKSSFSDEDGKSHSIQVNASGPFKLMITSSPMAAAEFLSWYVGKKGAEFEKDNKSLVGEIRDLIGQCQVIVTQIETTEKARKDDPKLETLQRDLLNRNVALSGKISSLVGSDKSIGKAREKYKLEGMTGTYGSMPKPPGDAFTADHQPQAAVLQAAAEFKYFSKTGELARRAAGRAKQGFAINLHSIRHIAGRTFGSKGKKTKESFLAEITTATQGKEAAEKRVIVVAKIKTDMMSDVKAMQGVAATGSVFWDDIKKDLPGKKEEKEKLVAEVSGRILSGESQIAAQDIDSMVGPVPPEPVVPPVRRFPRGPLQLQSSLKVSKPDDREEKEADQTAKKVMRMATPQSPYVVRFQDTIGMIQRRSAEGPPRVSSNVATGIQTSMGSGSPLPPAVQRFMEPRFGADFNNVRIHTGDKAARLNQDLSAHAFTAGNNIFFGKDKFQPESHDGKELIAHELSHTVQQGGVVQRRTIDIAGKRMYFMSDGKLIELPPDMTDAEATKLEAEARAAEKKLGKGPAPKPVPDVKKLVKAEKKETFKPEAKSKRTDKGKGKAAPGAAAAAAALLEGVGGGKAAQYLAAKGAPALLKGVGMLHKLKQNEQTHDDAGEKLRQSEQAIVIPVSDEQSKSNTRQVNTVSGRPAPPVDENKGKRKLQDTLAANVPRNIEDVDNFKQDKKAQHMGADVMGVVLADKNSVVSTFGDVQQTPAPTPSGHTPENLPPREVAPLTAPMNLGHGAVAMLQKEHTDVSNYTKEADGKLKEEGVTQEQLDMVDSGDLAEANREKKGMEKTAQTEPLAVQNFARQETETVDKDLKQEEKQERSRLTVKRNAGLGATTLKQKTAKTSLERKREEVAKQINDIYKTAQDNVKKKLADLETQSMKRFDEGNAKATKEFEDNVKRELDAYKDDRYSGVFGWARKAKDWLLGMDDLPRVKAIFENNRTAFVNTINKLVEDISNDNKKVIKECTDELANAKKKMKEFVDGLEPGLKDIGKKAAEEMNSKLADLDQFISQRQEELQNKLKDKQTAAIKAIDEKIEKMKEAMSGALAKLGKLLLLAAKKFFGWALEKFGVSLSTIEGIISKGVAVLKAIFTGPIKFVKNLVKAAGTGFENFGKNFLTHLKNAVFEWLTGSLQGLKLPESWDLKGILSVVFQMLGLTWQNIRAHLVRLIPEPAVTILETTFSLVKTLITQGPMAAWEQLKDIAGEIKNAFVDAVKDWIKTKVVEEAIKTVLAMFIPGAGIVRAIIAIYDTIVFFIQKAKDIIQMVGNFLGSIAEIAAGNIGAAAAALENGLARALKLVIEFLARFLRLTGITAKIREVIQKIRGKVDDVIGKVAKWIVEKGKALWSGVKAGVKGLIAWWKAKRSFQAADGQTHSLYFAGEERNAALMLQSDPAPFSDFVKRAQPGKDAAKVTAKTQALKIAGQIDTERNTAPAGSTPDQIETSRAQKATRVNELLEQLQPHTSVLFGSTVPDSFVGNVNTAVNAGGFGVSMSVKPLTNKNRPAGSDPTGAANPVYDALNERRNSPGGASYYIKGHLLNQGLGGPGAWLNLTPLSRSGNAQHETQAESVVKRTVDLSAIVEYNVTPNYSARSDKGSLLTQINNSLDPPIAKQVKAAIVSAEDWAPASLKVQAYFLDESLKRKNTIIDKTVANSVERKFESYFLSSSPKPEPVNLNTDDAAKIATIPGIGATPAANIVAVRKRRKSEGIKRFASFKQIADLVPGIGEARLAALESAGYVRLY